MKKLMIAAAIVCAAAFAQASSFSWTISGMNKVYVAGTTTSETITGNAVYLFCADNYSQETLLDAGKAFDTSKAVAQGTLNAGVLNTTDKKVAFDFGGESDWTKTGHFYMALIDGDNIYVSTSVNGVYQEKATTSLTTSGANSKNAATAWTKGDTFSKAGWYSTVPEPTSGLLLLLGVAGLALRRRRA